MSTKYFYKGMVANSISLKNGKPIPFIALSNGDGIIATEDPETIDALEIRIKERRGGVGAITVEQFDKFKADDEERKKNATPSSKPSAGIRLSPADPRPTAKPTPEKQSARPAVGRSRIGQATKIVPELQPAGSPSDPAAPVVLSGPTPEVGAP